MFRMRPEICICQYKTSNRHIESVVYNLTEVSTASLIIAVLFIIININYRFY